MFKTSHFAFKHPVLQVVLKCIHYSVIFDLYSFSKNKDKKVFWKKVSLSSLQEFWVKKIVNLSEKVIILTWDKSRDAKLKEISRHLNNLLTALLTPWQLLIWLNCSQFSSVLQIRFRQGVCREVTQWAYWIWEVIFLFCLKIEMFFSQILANSF